MKLISCHIDAFGKLKNADFDFDQLTLFCEDNGFGKTTLAQFLKAMFYGLPTSSKKANVLSERDLYKPFDFDGKFGGKIKFECDKGQFVVLRNFGLTPTLDKFVLIDAKTNLPSQIFSSNLGEDLFGVGKETFENSTFFAQKNLFSGINDDIRASLATGVLSGDDVDNLQKAQEKLQKKAKELRSDLRELKLDYDLKTEANLNSEEQILKINIKNVEEEIKNIDNTIKQYKKLDSKKDNKEIVDLKNEKLKIDSLLKSDCEKLKEKLEQKQTVLNSKKISDDEYLLLKNSQNVEKYKKNQKFWQIFLLFSLFLCASSVLGFVFKNNIVAYVFFAITVICAALTTVLIINSSKLSEEVKRIENILKNNKLSAEELLEDYQKIMTENDFLTREIKSLEFDIKNNQEKMQNLENNFYAKFNCLIDEYDIKNNQNAEVIVSLEKKFIELNADKKHLNANLDNLNEQKFELSEMIAQKKEFAEQIEHKLEILEKTSDFLDLSKNNISSRFVEPVTQRFNDYYQKILLNGEKIVIDSDLGMHFGDYKDVNFLSAGLLDLVYICKRFALIDLLFKNEKPFILLDDPFVNLDDKKLDLAKDLIKQLSKNYQIVMMSCQKSRI